MWCCAGQAASGRSGRRCWRNHGLLVTDLVFTGVGWDAGVVHGYNRVHRFAHDLQVFSFLPSFSDVNSRVLVPLFMMLVSSVMINWCGLGVLMLVVIGLGLLGVVVTRFGLLILLSISELV